MTGSSRSCASLSASGSSDQLASSDDIRVVMASCWKAPASPGCWWWAMAAATAPGSDQASATRRPTVVWCWSYSPDRNSRPSRGGGLPAAATAASTAICSTAGRPTPWSSPHRNALSTLLRRRRATSLPQAPEASACRHSACRSASWPGTLKVPLCSEAAKAISLMTFSPSRATACCSDTIGMRGA